MFDSVYMKEHNIVHTDVEVIENSFLVFTITFENGDKIKATISDGTEYQVTQAIPRIMKEKVAEYEWKLLQKERRNKIRKLNI